MKTKKISGPAIFMYSVMAFCVAACALGFYIYYSGVCENSVVLWSSIVLFMILYHFGMRIGFGLITKTFPINYRHPWYRQRGFEKGLYKFLRVRRWKDKVLTFEPDKYDFQKRTLDQLATTMAKSELDHWINEAISISSIFFFFVWGCFPAFFITAVAAMIFDAQFIVVQRYNRPIVLKLKKMRENRKNSAPECDVCAKNC